MRRKHSIFTPLSALPLSLFGYFDGFKTDSSVAAAKILAHQPPMAAAYMFIPVPTSASIPELSAAHPNGRLSMRSVLLWSVPSALSRLCWD